MCANNPNLKQVALPSLRRRSFGPFRGWRVLFLKLADSFVNALNPAAEQAAALLNMAAPNFVSLFVYQLQGVGFADLGFEKFDLRIKQR